MFRYGQANREEMTATEKTIYYPHKSQDREYMLQDGGGTHREAPGSVFRQRKGGSVHKSLYCGFCRKGWVRQGKQAYDWPV